ncbi:TetR family transcriptional regulator [Polaromonas sp.]|uniref:TetR/AcrR family transcriptional regulator n=1 Tax=Polaromonas sp. TaxID=1869339 RepID=UPI003262CFB6
MKNKPSSKPNLPAEPPLKKSDRTRAAILEAARSLFSERGYDGTTVREVAAAAAADPALVIRYFGSKEELFVRATEFELHLPDVAAMKGGNEGEALVRHFFEIWELGPSATAMTILLRSAVTNDAAADKMRELFRQQVLPVVARSGSRTTAPLRAGLIATQLLGLALCRYVLKLPGIATATPEELTANLAPTVQGYLSGKK